MEEFKPTLRACDKNLIFKYPNKLSRKLCNNRSTQKKLDIGVYKVNCNNCNKFYIGETGRSLNTRMREHKNDIKNDKVSSGIVKHVNETDHEFDFKNVELIYPNSNSSKRHIVETSFINTNKLKCVNLNSGFVCLDNIVSNNVCKLLKLKISN